MVILDFLFKLWLSGAVLIVQGIVICAMYAIWFKF